MAPLTVWCALLMSPDQTDLLSHRCRRVIVHTLGRENRFCRSAIARLPLPGLLRDYLMLCELGSPLQDQILKFITVTDTGPTDTVTDTGDSGDGGDTG